MLALINDTGIVVVLAAVVLLFGASRLPQLARNLAEARKEFNKAHDDVDEKQLPPAAAVTAPNAYQPAPAQRAG